MQKHNVSSAKSDLRLKHLFTVIIVLGFVLSGCNLVTPQSSSPTKGDVIVYAAVPVSGFQANAGQTVVGGVRLAAAEINRSGGVNGYKVVVRTLDDESTDDVAVSNVEVIKQAISKGERVLGVIGHLNSGQTLAAMELYNQMRLIVITPTASELSITQKNYKNFFRVNANDDIQAAFLAQFISQKLNLKTIAVIHNDTQYGIGLAKAVTKNLQEKGVSVALTLQVKEGQNQFKDEIQKIKSANPGGVFYAGYEIETPYLREALVTNGLNIPMVASDGAFLGVTIDEANGTAEGMFVSAFAPSPKAIASATWFEAYQAVEYRNPDTYSVNGYVAMSILAEAARKANSLEMDKIADAIRNNTFKTIMGDLRYQPNGDLVDARVWIYQVTGNEFKQVDWGK